MKNQYLHEDCNILDTAQRNVIMTLELKCAGQRDIAWIYDDSVLNNMTANIKPRASHNAPGCHNTNHQKPSNFDHPVCVQPFWRSSHIAYLCAYVAVVFCDMYVWTCVHTQVYKPHCASTVCRHLLYELIIAAEWLSSGSVRPEFRSLYFTLSLFTKYLLVPVPWSMWWALPFTSLPIRNSQ
jgi:hypothetical protein